MRICQEEVDAVELLPIHLRTRRKLQHCVEVDGWLRIRAFADQTVAMNAEIRARLRDRLLGMGLGCDESFANFLLARFASREEAEAAEARLRQDGILVRKVAGYKLPDCLRITVPDAAGCERVAGALAAFRGAPA